MELSRRTVLRSAVACGVAGLAPLRWAGAAGAQARTAALWLNRSTYPSLVGTAFIFNNLRGQRVLNLEAVRDLDPTASRPRGDTSEQRFSLLFAGDASLGQGTFTVRHSQLGATSLFAVPVGGGGTPRFYEVVVNRL